MPLPDVPWPSISFACGQFDRLHHTALDHQGAAGHAIPWEVHDEDARKARSMRLRASTMINKTSSDEDSMTGPPSIATASSAPTILQSVQRTDDPLPTDRTGGTSHSGIGFHITPEFVYYCWVGRQPAVPPYATSIEGCTGLIFSPPEPSIDSSGGGDFGGDRSGGDESSATAVGDKLLMCWERGTWNTPGGAIERGELNYEGLYREAGEEVGATLDKTFSPIYLGGWQIACARDQRINDNFGVYATRAASLALCADGIEIQHARWLPWRPMYERWLTREMEDGAVDLSGLLGFEGLPEGKRVVSAKVMGWLHTWYEGNGLPCEIKDNQDAADARRTRQITIGVPPPRLPPQPRAISPPPTEATATTKPPSVALTPLAVTPLAIPEDGINLAAMREEEMWLASLADQPEDNAEEASLLGQLEEKSFFGQLSRRLMSGNGEEVAPTAVRRALVSEVADAAGDTANPPDASRVASFAEAAKAKRRAKSAATASAAARDVSPLTQPGDHSAVTAPPAALVPSATSAQGAMVVAPVNSSPAPADIVRQL